MIGAVGWDNELLKFLEGSLYKPLHLALVGIDDVVAVGLHAHRFGNIGAYGLNAGASCFVSLEEDLPSSRGTFQKLIPGRNRFPS